VRGRLLSVARRASPQGLDFLAFITPLTLGEVGRFGPGEVRGEPKTPQPGFAGAEALGQGEPAKRGSPTKGSLHTRKTPIS
jgi:hypothetical protein